MASRLRARMGDRVVKGNASDGGNASKGILRYLQMGRNKGFLIKGTLTDHNGTQARNSTSRCGKQGANYNVNIRVF